MIVVSEKVIITGFYRNLRQHLNKCEHNGIKWVKKRAIYNKIRDNSFSAHAKFSVKLTFLTP